ncbi:MAG: hypothetical protein JXA54_15720 [Candidatus Heimdallarchaeota archaeon]|nr:hypothetical protein [Candidatus Heimdallarchaeota archaeon]
MNMDFIGMAINNPQDYNFIKLVNSIYLSLLFLGIIFMSLMIWSAVLYSRERKANFESRKYLPRVIGFSISVLLVILAMILFQIFIHRI